MPWGRLGCATPDTPRRSFYRLCLCLSLPKSLLTGLRESVLLSTKPARLALLKTLLLLLLLLRLAILRKVA